MRKIVKYSLCCITIVCGYIICYVGLGWFWSLGSSDNFERINKVLINLSYSYMAGFCFYILVEYFPKKVAQKKAYIVWEKGIVNVYMRMSEMIAALKMIYDIDIEDKELSIDEVKDLETYQPKNEKVYFGATTYINDIDENGIIKGFFVFHENLNELATRIKKEILSMIQLPSTPNIEIELIEIISEIESCEFLNTCDRLLDNPLYYEHTKGNFNIDFYQFVQLHEKLSKYKFKKLSYKYEKLMSYEIAAMKVEQKEVFQEIKKQNINLENCVFYKNNIKYVIKDGELIY